MVTDRLFLLDNYEACGVVKGVNLIVLDPWVKVIQQNYFSFNNLFTVLKKYGYVSPKEINSETDVWSRFKDYESFEIEMNRLSGALNAAMIMNVTYNSLTKFKPEIVDIDGFIETVFILTNGRLQFEESDVLSLFSQKESELHALSYLLFKDEVSNSIKENALAIFDAVVYICENFKQRNDELKREDSFTNKESKKEVSETSKEEKMEDSFIAEEDDILEELLSIATKNNLDEFGSFIKSLMDIENTRNEKSTNKEHINIQNDENRKETMNDSMDERNIDVLLNGCKGSEKQRTAKIITEDDLDTLALKLALMSIFLD